MKTETLTGKIVYIKSALNSVNANPAYWVTVENAHGERRNLRTQSDAACAYGLEDAEYAEQPHTFRLTNAGRIAEVLATV
jgi:hypothetical protein